MFVDVWLRIKNKNDGKDVKNEHPPNAAKSALKKYQYSGLYANVCHTFQISI